MSLSLRAPTGLSGSRGHHDAFANGVGRISSGLRVGRAADDAAGLAISERMRAQVGGSAMAARNAHDGIALLQTADGGVSAITSLLQRARELAVQAASSGTTTSGDREAAAAEVRQLVAEIDRVATGTTYAGQRLLDGSRPAGFAFQLGADAGDTFTASAYDVGAVALLLTTAGAQQTTGTSTPLVGSPAPVPAPDPGTTTTTTTYAARSAPLTTYASVQGQREFVFSVGGGAVQSFKIRKDVTYTAATIDGLRQELQAKLDAALPPIPVTVGVADDGDGPRLEMTVTGSPETTLTVTGSGAQALGFTTTATTSTTTTAAATPAASVAPDEPGATTALGTALADLVAAGSAGAISLCDSALTTVSGVRAELGAGQNQLEHRLAVLATTEHNLSQARSRLVDADIATEWGQVLRAQLLTEAGQAVQAQGVPGAERIVRLLTAL